jgi:hypothetical protein
MRHPDDWDNSPERPMRGDLGKAFETLKSFIKGQDKEPVCKNCHRPRSEHYHSSAKCKKYEK